MQWIVALLIGIVAKNKNRNYLLWASLSLLLSALDELVLTGSFIIAGMSVSKLQLLMLVIISILKPAIIVTTAVHPEKSD